MKQKKIRIQNSEIYLDELCSIGNYRIKMVEGGIPYVMDPRGLDLRCFYNTHYELVSPKNFSHHKEFVDGTVTSYDLYEKGLRIGPDNFSIALKKMENSHKLLKSVIPLDKTLSDLLFLEDSLILIEKYLLSGYFNLAKKNDEPSSTINEEIKFDEAIRRIDELVEEENFFFSLNNRKIKIGDGSNKKIDLFAHTQYVMGNRGGMRILVK